LGQQYALGDATCDDSIALIPAIRGARSTGSRRGAYRRYKDLLVRRGALERWYGFSNKSEETALREWCAENGIELSETRGHAVAISR
jgi:hypothetical protein